MSEEHPPLPGNGVNILMALIWPGVAFFSVLMASVIILVLGVAFASGSDAGEVARLIGQSNAIAKLLTMIVVVVAVSVLTLAKEVPGSAALAVLASIVGYMMGGLTSTASGP